MKKVFQTKFHGENSRGNCLAACLASVFDLSISDLPEFEMMERDEWIHVMLTWLEDRGYDLDVFRTNPGGELAKGTYYMAIGKSPRGIDHCVVYRDGFMVHDPHPQGGGLVKVDSYWTFIPCQEPTLERSLA